MKNYVKIQSSKTIAVTAGLQHKDVTNPDAHVPDRLRIAPTWPKSTVLIKEGVDWYPSEIIEWATVKSLVKHKILTIGEESDDCENEDAKKEKENIKKNLPEEKPTTKRKTKLEEIAE